MCAFVLLAHNDANTGRISMHCSLGYLVWTRINSEVYYIVFHQWWIGEYDNFGEPLKNYVWKNKSMVIRLCVSVSVLMSSMFHLHLLVYAGLVT